MKIFYNTAIAVCIGLLATAGFTSPDTRPLPLHREQRDANAAQEQALVARYGAPAFATCFVCNASERANPFARAACLRKAEACLAGTTISRRNCAAGEYFSDGACVSADTGCRERFGEFAFALGTIETGNYTCDCEAGYGWNDERTACDLQSCPSDLVYYSAYRDERGAVLDGRCLTPDAACSLAYGELARAGARSAAADDAGGTACVCGDGARWNTDQSACEAAPVVLGLEASPEDIAYADTLDRERRATVGRDDTLASRLSGRILLQVEEKGEAWYVHPASLTRFYLSTPSRAFAVMRDFGLGATHAFISGHSVYPASVAGRILIDVEDHGKAYYIDPSSRRANYLGSPSQAFAVMRQVGLGISNGDIRKIELGN